jgi:hypothetical protein
VIELDDQPLLDAAKVGDFREGASFAILRELAVSGVQQRDVGGAMSFARYSRADAGIHAATKKHHRFAQIVHRFPTVGRSFDRPIHQ